MKLLPMETSGAKWLLGKLRLLVLCMIASIPKTAACCARPAKFKLPGHLVTILPWRWRSDPDKLVNEILDACRHVNLTKEQAANIIFRATDPIHIIWAEDILDYMWDAGLLHNLGHYNNYAYAITAKGKQHDHA